MPTSGVSEDSYSIYISIYIYIYTHTHIKSEKVAIMMETERDDGWPARPHHNKGRTGTIRGSHRILKARETYPCSLSVAGI